MSIFSTDRNGVRTIVKAKNGISISVFPEQVIDFDNDSDGVSFLWLVRLEENHIARGIFTGETKCKKSYHLILNIYICCGKY